MLPRFTHLLIPIDAVVKNSAVVDISFELAVANNARVSLLHVIQKIESGDDLPDSESERFYESVRQRVEGDLDHLSQRFLEAKLNVEAKVRIGDVLHEIDDFTRSRQVDLIVMRSHRVDPQKLAATWGTLSYKVSVICPCPILLVK